MSSSCWLWTHFLLPHDIWVLWVISYESHGTMFFWKCWILMNLGLIFPLFFFLSAVFLSTRRNIKDLSNKQIWLDDRHKLAPCIWPDLPPIACRIYADLFFSIIFMWQLQKFWGNSKCFSKSVLSLYTKTFLKKMKFDIWSVWHF